jgi:hypothetical protein
LNFNYDKFEEEKAAWKAQSNMNYTYEYWSGDFLLEHVLVTVENGVYKESTPFEDSWRITSYEKSIDDIYDDLEKLIQSYYNAENDDDYTDVEYNSMYGPYLPEISIEYDSSNIPVVCHKSLLYPGDEMTADGNYTRKILNFKKIVK